MKEGARGLGVDLSALFAAAVGVIPAFSFPLSFSACFGVLLMAFAPGEASAANREAFMSARALAWESAVEPALAYTICVKSSLPCSHAILVMGGDSRYGAPNLSPRCR